MDKKLKYQHGFGNQFETEALAGALPIGQNSPQQVPYGLYAEQISGTAFTTPRHKNLRSWLYKIRPSVLQSEFTPSSINNYLDHGLDSFSPTQLRWDPIAIPEQALNFIEGMITLADNKHTASIHYYVCNKSMDKQFFYNADGELLIVPQLGALLFKTEMGALEVSPQEIIVIPRGIKFQVELIDKQARGYICENRGQALHPPELGPIGANGLANLRDFCYPTASFDDIKENYELVCKFDEKLWSAYLEHSPLDVVAWHGNYAPYKYDLNLFNTINTVSFDHPDPSIFTVLTSQSNTAGVANIDFVIFPERWMVAEHTFRPPYFHRNIMNEFMGLIKGEYDAKPGGFMPGGFSLHNCMSAHGPDYKSFRAASTKTLKPQRYKNTLAFMFESNHIWAPTQFALDSESRQQNYLKCWQKLPVNFKSEE